MYGEYGPKDWRRERTSESMRQAIMVYREWKVLHEHNKVSSCRVGRKNSKATFKTIAAVLKLLRGMEAKA